MLGLDKAKVTNVSYWKAKLDLFKNNEQKQRFLIKQNLDNESTFISASNFITSLSYFSYLWQEIIHLMKVVHGITEVNNRSKKASWITYEYIIINWYELEHLPKHYDLVCRKIALFHVCIWYLEDLDYPLSWATCSLPKSSCLTDNSQSIKYNVFISRIHHEV